MQRGTVARAGAIGVPILAIVVVLSLSSVAEDAPEPIFGHADYPFRFDTVAQMVYASDLVIQGTVVETAPGRVVDDGHTRHQSRDVTVQISDVLHGSAKGEVVLFEESGWEDGRPLVLNGVQPSTAGEEVLLFLAWQALPDGDVLQLVSDQGRYSVIGGELRGAANGDPLIEELESLGTGAKQAIEAASDEVIAGNVEPADPAFWSEEDNPPNSSP